MDEKYVIHGAKPNVSLPSVTLGVEIYTSLCRVSRDKLALRDESTGEEITYGKLLDTCICLAEALKTAEYSGQNVVIGICSENSIFFHIPVIAAMFTCTVTVTLNPNYTNEELEHTLNISQPKIVFCSPKTVQKIIDTNKKLTFIEKLVVLGSKETPGIENLTTFIENNLKKDQSVQSYNFKPTEGDSEKVVAFILWSSGTTGLPKGVMLSHRNVMVRMTHSRDPYFKANNNDILFGFLAMFHGFGLLITIEALIGHQKVITINQFEENLFLKTIQDYKISSLYITPPLAIFLGKTPKVENYDLTSIKEFLCGSAPLSKETEEQIMARFDNPTMRQGYGLSEATMANTLIPNGKTKHGSVGQVTSYMSLKIINPETMEVLGPNNSGEICLKGPAVALGYYKNPEATKKTFTENGWLRTGDLGYYDQENYVYIIDRIKELIKYQGIQIAPAEIEALLINHPKIRDAAVIGKPDPVNGELPTAFIVKKENIKITEKEIHHYVNDLLIPQKRLSGGIYFVDVIPKNPSGKILKKDLREKLRSFS